MDDEQDSPRSIDSIESGDELPTIACSRCDRTWSLERAFHDPPDPDHVIERFALDHERHTGHYPDDVRPWIADCRRCPDGERYLRETPTRRWAETHAQHTTHPVAVLEPGRTSPADVVHR